MLDQKAVPKDYVVVPMPISVGSREPSRPHIDVFGDLVPTGHIFTDTPTKPVI